MPPKAWGPREREGWNALREHVQLKARRRKTCAERYNWYLKYMIHIYGMDAAIRNRVCYNRDLGYGHSHPTQIKQIDSGMVAAIQSVSHVHNDNNPQSQPGLQQTQSRVLRSISTQTKYKFEHANLWAEVEHARTSPDYQPMMKAVNRRERNHQ